MPALGLPAPLARSAAKVMAWLHRANSRSPTPANAGESHDDALRRTEEECGALFELAAVGEALVDLATGRFLRSNQKLASIVGAPRERVETMRLSDVVLPDDESALRAAMDSLQRGHVPEIDIEVRLKPGKPDSTWAQITATRVRGTDSDRHAIMVIQDISTRKQMEAEFARYRERLQDLVAERSGELRAMNDQLRAKERMASMGTLCAGLGHDMGNLLLPLRLRLESMDIKGVPRHLKEDMQAITQCAIYLQRLANGLRLLALDADHADVTEQTDLQEWWRDVEPLLNHALPRRIELEWRFHEALPRVQLSPHRLTQAMLNLVLNAGEAIVNDTPGRVTCFAEPGPDGYSVRVGVADTGIGMTPSVQARCLEPFYTSKPRALSTGMGLAIVHGIVQRVHGAIEIESEPGKGAKFTLILPSARRDQRERTPAAPSLTIDAVITLDDRRMATYVSTLLSILEARVVDDFSQDRERPAIWVTHQQRTTAQQIRRFLRDRANSQVIIFGEAPEQIPSDRVLVFSHRPRPATLRRHLRALTDQLALGNRRIAEIAEAS
jgi:PAS domain S-box-containing protein